MDRQLQYIGRDKWETEMDLRRDGVNFVVTLSHDEVGSAGVAGGALATAFPEILPVVAVITEIMEVMDAVGGNNGVEFSGAIGAQFFLILPHTGGILGSIVNLAEWVATYSNPIGLVLSMGIPIIGHIIGASSGEIHCDEDNVGSEETFSIIATGSGKVAIGTFNGFFTDDHDDNLAYANRSQILADEQFDMILQADGTVGFRGNTGLWMCADRNRGGRRVTVDRSSLGEWESWSLQVLGNGKFALRESEGKYASVAK